MAYPLYNIRKGAIEKKFWRSENIREKKRGKKREDKEGGGIEIKPDKKKMWGASIFVKITYYLHDTE